MHLASCRGPARTVLAAGLLVLGLVVHAGSAAAQDKALSGRAAAADANGNGVIDRDEARGPLAQSFDEIDKDKSGTLDGAEVRAFFAARGGGPGGGPGGGRGGGRFGTAAVTTDTIQRGPVSETVPVFGRIVANQAGVIAALARGGVAEIKVRVGDHVKEGQVIAVLVQDILRAERDQQAAKVADVTANVRTARAQLDIALQELQRLERLRSSAAFPGARYEDKRTDVDRLRAMMSSQQAKLEQARAELRAADLSLAYSTIKAPYAGVVSQRHTEVGAYLNVGSPVVTLINDSSFEVEAEVPAANVRGLTPGRVVEGSFEEGGTQFSTKVRAVVPEENPLARTRTVRFTANFADAPTPPAVNQTVVLQVPLGPAHEAVTVHKDAIVFRSGQPIVYVVDGNRQVAAREVTLGQAVGTRFVVLSGVSPGEDVVIRGNERLRPGQTVEVRPAGSS